MRFKVDCDKNDNMVNILKKYNLEVEKVNMGETLYSYPWERRTFDNFYITIKSLDDLISLRDKVGHIGIGKSLNGENQIFIKNDVSRFA